MSDRMTRRRFLRANAAMAVGTGLLGRQAWAQTTASQPSDTVSVGIIGCGERGKYLTYVCQVLPGARVAAICDVNRERLAKVHEQLGGKAKAVHDYRDLLGDKTIDAVIVATNTHWHALIATDACAAGKDVYLEKPVATSVAEGRAVIAAAQRHKRIIQMGTHQRSFEHYREAVEIVRSGRLGHVSHVHVWDVEDVSPGFGTPPDGPPPPELDWDFWLGPSPNVPYNPNRYAYHYWFFDYDGAHPLAWGVHHYDIVHWAMGVTAPTSAEGMGGHFAFRDNREWPDTFNGACVYPPGPVAKNGFLMSYTMRHGCAQLIEGRAHGKAFYGTNGVLVLDRRGYEIFSPSSDCGRTNSEEKVAAYTREHQVVQNHMQAFLDGVRTRKPPTADVLTGHRAGNPGHLMNISWRVGRRVQWDAENERIIDDPQAGAYLSKSYRRPWSLPEA